MQQPMHQWLHKDALMVQYELWDYRAVERQKNFVQIWLLKEGLSPVLS